MIYENVNENNISKPKKQVRFFEYKFINLDENKLELYNPNLKLFEFKMAQNYKPNSDNFIINYGNDYFAFFKRLGDVNYIIIQHDNEKIIIGTACAILRKYSGKKNNQIPFWYLCDLKIEKKHRGQNLTKKLFRYMYRDFIKKSQRGYLISMNDVSQQIIHIFDDISKIFVKKYILIKLLIYSVSVKIMKKIERFFKCAFENISYLSLNGTKDIFSSTMEPIDLYHLQHGFFTATENTKKIDDLSENAIIMFCFPENSPLKSILDSMDVRTEINATIISWSMDFFDWHNILTSDI